MAHDNRIINDSISDVYQPIVDARNPLNRNEFIIEKPLDKKTLYSLSDTVVGRRAVEIKRNGIIDMPLKFKTTEDQEFFEKKVKPLIADVVESMLIYGRGVIVLVEPVGEDKAIPLSTPLSAEFNPNNLELRFFSGYDILASVADMNLVSRRFLCPIYYSIWGEFIHHSRVVDFTYIKVPNNLKPMFNYGGKSEFQHVYEELKRVGMTGRSAATITEKVSHTVAKVKNGRTSMGDESQARALGSAFALLADYAHTSTMSIIDSEEDMFLLTSTFPQFGDFWIQNKEILCSGFGLSEGVLFGKNGAVGLSNNGITERTADANTIRALMSGYVEHPLNELMLKCGQHKIEVGENKATTSIEDAQFEATVVATGISLMSMGLDGAEYVKRKGVIIDDSIISRIRLEADMGEEIDLSEADLAEALRNEQAGAEPSKAEPTETEGGLSARVDGLLGRADEKL